MQNQNLPKNRIVLDEMITTNKSSLTSSSQQNGIGSQRVKKLLQGVRIGGKLIRYKLFKKRFPLMVNLLLTNKCNLKCFYCYPQVFERETNDITTEKWLSVVDEFHEMGTEVMVLLGGEPLLHKGIDQIVDRVKQHGMICEMITNGYYLEKKEAIVKKLDSLCISIDGDEEENDNNRGKGSFKKAIDAIQLCKSWGLTTRVKAVITQNNISSLDFLCDFAKEENVVLTLTLPSVHTENGDLKLTTEQAVELWKKVRDYKKRGYPIGHTLTSIDYMLRWPYNHYEWVDKETSKNFGTDTVLPCIREELSCYADVDGMIYPCAILWNKFPGKSFMDVGVDQAWDNLKEKPCHSCGFIGEIELNLLFTLSAKNIFESAKYYFKSQVIPTK